MQSSNKTSEKSPIRSALRQTDNSQTIENIINLTNSLEKKRKLLNRIYNDLQNNTNEVHTKESILKHVQFESIDTTNHDETLNQTNLNNTFTIEIKKQISAKIPVINPNKKQFNKSPQTKQTSILNKPEVKVTPLKPAVNKTPTRQVLTYQQKKQIQLENKTKFDKKVQEIREKIIQRKFGYQWIRIYFYSKSKIKSANKLLLPSQLE